MASLTKLRGKYYARVYLRKEGRYKEKLIPLNTTDESVAKAELKNVKRQERKIKRGLLKSLEINRRSLPIRNLGEKYLDDCRRRLSKKTISIYDIALRSLINVFPGYDIQDFKKDDLSNILDYLQERGSVTTVNIRLRAIKTFFLWAVENEYTDKIPFKIKQIKQERELPKFLSPQEMESLYDVIIKAGDMEFYSMVQVYEATGMRLQELFNSRIQGNYIHITHTKGKKERIVPIPHDLIDDYKTARSTKHTESWISHRFTEYRRLAGISEDKSLHSLRHTFALKMLLQYGNIYIVKELLGHHSVSTTEIYLKFPFDYLKQVFERKIEINQMMENIDTIPIPKSVNQFYASRREVVV
ncbi:MAG: tyrosine-type recombinase/integrase [Candidatus Marinimicrobia bacterium]|nr:tyrosine-type recombinase/integrase [Candidatus Neomarinimicrobiota bacterium]